MSIKGKADEDIEMIVLLKGKISGVADALWK
jgi:hypothetical protein